MRNYSVRKRVLVTGGAGFIGSHLCERLMRFMAMVYGPLPQDDPMQRKPDISLAARELG